MKKFPKTANAPHRHSNVFLKSLAAKLSKTSEKKLEQDSIVMSPRLQDVSRAEVQLLLNNLISAEDLNKIRELEESFTSLGSGSRPYPQIPLNQGKNPKSRRSHPEDSAQSVREEVDVYLKKFEEDVYLKRFSSTNIIFKDQSTQISLEVIKDIERSEKRIQEQKSSVSLKAKKSNDGGSEKRRSTLKRIRRKMELMKKYCPEIYFSQESVISMWTRGVPTLRYD